MRAQQPLEEGDPKATARGHLRLDHGRQLQVIAGEHGPPAAQQRHPARRLERLCGLVDDDKVKGEAVGQAAERAVGGARVAVDGEDAAAAELLVARLARSERVGEFRLN